MLNDISRADIGFDSAENEVTIVTDGHEQPVPLAAPRARWRLPSWTGCTSCGQTAAAKR